MPDCLAFRVKPEYRSRCVMAHDLHRERMCLPVVIASCCRNLPFVIFTNTEVPVRLLADHA
eukprot:6432706-Amphidinium_carterae.1